MRNGISIASVTKMEKSHVTIANLEELIDMTCQTESLVREQDGIGQELNIMPERLNDLIRDNARAVQDRSEYAKKEEMPSRDGTPIMRGFLTMKKT